jgi:hypothetical protein
MSLQPIQNTSVTGGPSSSIAPNTNFPLAPLTKDPSSATKLLQPSLNTLDVLPNAPRLTKEELRAQKASEVIPFETHNMERIKSELAQIDIRDPQTHKIITPHHVISYLEHVAGNVTMELLEPGSLTEFETTEFDLSSISIDLGKNTNIDFIALDEITSFLVSNGTHPENIVIADNMAKKEEGLPMILSLNDNSEQNLDILHF